MLSRLVLRVWCCSDEKPLLQSGFLRKEETRNFPFCLRYVPGFLINNGYYDARVVRLKWRIIRSIIGSAFCLHAAIDFRIQISISAGGVVSYRVARQIARLAGRSFGIN
jgi:hypothetical protein